MRLLPKRWASLVPGGLGYQKPHHYREMGRAFWRNRHELSFAWRILRDGVCDGCGLGASGLHDWTMPGTHLCQVRLDLLSYNTASALDVAQLEDVSPLLQLSSKELRDLGRLPVPLVRRRGARGFTPTGWNEVLGLMADALRPISPDRTAFYLTSRGLTNEVYYAAQKAARFFGTNHVDGAARLCHVGSLVALRQMLGQSASTCSYRDWLDADLIVVLGANTPNTHPVTLKYLLQAQKNGARVAAVNPLREPGYSRYWVPSSPMSAVFGTRFADAWFDVNIGGDLAFLVGALRALIEMNAIDHEFVGSSTVDFDAARAQALDTPWSVIEAESGTSREQIEAFARLLADCPKTVLVWGTGINQHAHGADTVRALVDVALARGLVGRPGSGVMPLAGQSGLQGAGDVGCRPDADPAEADRWERVWGFPVPRSIGMTVTEMLDAAALGDIDAFWIVGGNFLETLGDEEHSREALHRPRLRIHHDIVLSSAMLVEPSEVVVLLPATTRYETPGGGTETSTERRVIYSPEIPGRRIGVARPEWWVFGEVMARVKPDAAELARFWSSGTIREEMADAIPLYAGIEKLRTRGDEFQWGGRTLYAGGAFDTPDKKAHFVPVQVKPRTRRPAHLLLATRRGRQFNSMVHEAEDALTGASRDDVLMSRQDAREFGLRDGASVRLVSAHGSFDGRVKIAPIRAGNLQVFWPEGNALLPASVVDPASLGPDFNTQVRVETSSGERP